MTVEATFQGPAACIMCSTVPAECARGCDL